MSFSIFLSLLGAMFSVFRISPDISKRNFKYKLGLSEILLFIGLFLSILVLIIFRELAISQGIETFSCLGGIKILPSFFFFFLQAIFILLTFLIFVKVLFFEDLKDVRGFMINLKNNISRKNFSDATMDFKNFYQQILNYHEKKKKKELIIFFTEIIQNKEYLSFLIDHHFEFLISLMEVNLKIDKELFWTNVGELLVKKRNSIFYIQMDEDFRGEKTIINFLERNLEDINDFNFWNAISFAVLDYLENQSKEDKDWENFEVDIYGSKIKSSPLYASISFFKEFSNIILKNDVSNHIFLNQVYNQILKPLLDNMNYDHTSSSGEFQNGYEFHLYSIFELFNGNIRYIINSDYDIELYDYKKTQITGGNIIQFSMLVYTWCMFEVIRSNIRPHFKKYLRNIYLDTLFDLKDKKNYFNSFLDIIEIEMKQGFFRKIYSEEIKKFFSETFKPNYVGSWSDYPKWSLQFKKGLKKLKKVLT